MPIMPSYPKGYHQLEHCADDPNLGLWHYRYNALGQLAYQVDAKGNCTQLYYDAIGRVTNKYYHSNTNAICQGGVISDMSQYLYDNSTGSSSFGLLLSEANNTSHKTYSYDGYGRAEAITTDTLTGLVFSEISYYDAYSRPQVNYDASAEGVKYHYTSTGYQQSIQGMSTSIYYQKILGMDAFGHIIQEQSGNNIHTLRQYDARGRIDLIQSGTVQGASDVQFLSYDHDQVGNLIYRSDQRNSANVLNESFSYDVINRLTQVDIEAIDNVGTHNYTAYQLSYDDAGRRLSKTGLDQNAITYSYDANHFHGVANTSDGKTYVYDQVGNQTLSDGRTLNYTAFNKVSSMSKGTFNVAYGYDANNQKIRRTDTKAGDETITWYIGNVEVILTDWNTPEQRIKYKRYIGDQTVFTRIGTDNMQIEYLHKDHLGSVQTVSEQGFSSYGIRHLSYDAFGKRRSPNQWDQLYTAFNPIDGITNKGFTGQEHIDELNLIDYRARIYDPNLGMMLQADTVIPNGHVTDSLNRYTYVFNNPLSYTDPTGHTPYFNGVLAVQVQNTVTGWQIQRLLKRAGKTKSQISRFLGNLTGSSSLPAGVQSGSFGNGDIAFGVGRDQAWDGSNQRRLSRKTKEGWNRTPYGVFDEKGGQKRLSDVVDFPAVNVWEDLKTIAGFFDPSQAIRGCYTETCGFGGWSLAALEVIPVVKWGRRGGDFLDTAANNANKVKLNKKLASDEQVAELRIGKGVSIAGNGSPKPLRDKQRLSDTYGGDPNDWAKVRSSNRKHSDGFNQETHAYQNAKTGDIVEMKTKVDGH